MDSAFLKLLTAFCLICVGPIPAFSDAESWEGGKSAPFSEIRVNGKLLTGPNTAAQRRDSRILLPIAAIARALGDTLEFDIADRRVTVRRQTGSVADFFVDRGRIDENGSNILVVSNAGEIVLSPNTDEFLLPLEITAVFFDVSIRYDDVKAVVNISRSGHPAKEFAETVGRSSVELYQVGYEIGLNRYSSALSQNLVLNGSGRIGDGRFRFSANSSSSFRDLAVRSTAFSFERPNGQKYFAGDIGVGGDLQLLSSYVRGASAAIPTGDLILAAFAGRSYSGILPAGPDVDHHPYRRFPRDTNIFGGTLSKNADRASRTDPWFYSAGAMSFGRVGRQGIIGSAGVHYSGSRLKVRSDVAVGQFSGQNSHGALSRGSALAFEVAGTFQASDRLAFHGRATRVGSRFLGPQAGVREPIDLKAGGVTWSPVRWLSTSVNASLTRRPGDPTVDNKYVTAAFALSPGAKMPRLYVSHIESSTKQSGSAAFTIVNASTEFARARLYFNGTRVRNFGITTVNGTAGAAFSINDSNSVEVSQGIGSRGVLGGLIDWRSNSFLGKKLSFSAGAGYNRNNSRTSIYERVSASVKLPRQTSLQVSYYHVNNNATVMISLKGLLFKKRESDNFLAANLKQMNSYGSVSGRVYQDVDLNGRFDDGIDKPHANAKVRIDGNRYVLTDESGLYSFESITAGDHMTYLDLQSIRADLTLLSEASRETRLQPGGRSTIDFRLVRTGRISGQLWYDENENGEFDDGEALLADVRIVTSSGRDTLTGPDGRFTIGDLPPGEYIVLIDEKTLPDKTRPGSQTMTVRVLPGRESGDIYMAVIPAVAEVKRFPSRSN